MMRYGRMFLAIVGGLLVALQSVSIAGENHRLVYPNPFCEGGSTTFELSVPPPGSKVIVEVYDIRGAYVRTIYPLDGPREPIYTEGGNIPLPWDGRNNFGESVPPGVYVAVLTANSSIVKAVKVVKLDKGC